jgi:hypothetical protein
MKKIAAAALVLCAGTASAAEGELSLGIGFNYSVGDYGSGTDTEIVSVPVTARYETERWVLKLAVPYISVSGDVTVVPGVGRVGTAATQTRTDSGPGDIVASATYAAYFDRAARLGVDVTGKVKLATAEESRGLGTGETDISLLVEPYKTFDRTTMFGSLGYHMLGAPLEDVMSWSAGVTYRLNDRDSVGAAYDWREKVSSGAGDLSEVTLFWTRRLDRQWKLQAYVLKGFSNGSPDVGVGASIAYAF